jgi:hypothetical protein
VQSLTMPECTKLVEDALGMETPSEILDRCTEVAQQHYGELLG